MSNSTETPRFHYEVVRRNSGAGGRGKVVARFEFNEGRKAVDDADARDQGREWNDPWHQVRRVED